MPPDRFAGPPCRGVPQLDELEHLAHPSPPAAPEHPEQARDEVDVLVGREVRVQREQLGHVADPLAGRAPELARVLAQDPDLALVGVEGPGEHPDRRRLAGAGRPDRRPRIVPGGTVRSSSWTPAPVADSRLVTPCATIGAPAMTPSSCASLLVVRLGATWAAARRACGHRARRRRAHRRRADERMTRGRLQPDLRRPGRAEQGARRHAAGTLQRRGRRRRHERDGPYATVAIATRLDAAWRTRRRATGRCRSDPHAGARGGRPRRGPPLLHRRPARHHPPPGGRGFAYRDPDGTLDPRPPTRSRRIRALADPAGLDRRLDLPGPERPPPGDRPRRAGPQAVPLPPALPRRRARRRSSTG